MQIEHVAVWTHNLETLREFYVHWFGASSGEKYTNPAKQFESYFLTFDSGARLELMQRPDVAPRSGDHLRQPEGFVHLAFSVGSAEKVDALTNDLRAAGVKIIGEPRATGDGYYESTILDPDGNIIEITI